MNEQTQVQMEAALIGAVVRDRAVMDGISPVRPEDFVDRRHQGIWSKVMGLANEGRLSVWDAQIIAHEAQLDAAYLMALEMSAPRGRDRPEEYAKLISSRAHERRIRSAAEAIASSGSSGEQLMRLVEQFLETAQGKATGGPRRLGDGLGTWLSEKERMMADGESSFIDMGVPGLDRRIGGLRPGEYMIVAGRPATGKTQFALSVARHVARMKRPVHICSLEMLEDQMIDRMASTQDIHLSRLRSPHREPDGGERLIAEMVKACGELQDLPIWVDYTSDDFHSIASHARRMKRAENTQLLIVDYLQLVEASGRSRAEEVTTISRGLKRLAVSLKIPVIALAQMNRGIEMNAGRRPMLSDLRESGSLEQDADFVMFLWRHALSFMQDGVPPSEAALNVVELITAKARQGDPGTDYQRAEFAYSRFRNMDQDDISMYLAAIGARTAKGGEDRDAPGRFQ